MKVTKKLFVLFSLFLLISLILILSKLAVDQEKQNVAIVTCNIMAESRNMDAAMKIREINAAREKINEAPYLLGGKEIQESFQYGLCTNLVLNDPEYQNTLFQLKELERIARLKAQEEARIKREKDAEEARIAKEKEEKARIALEKAVEEDRIKREKAREEARAIEREEARIAREKAVEEARIKREEAAKKKYATAIMEKRYIDSFDPLDLYSKLKIQNIVLEEEQAPYRIDGGGTPFIDITLNRIQCHKISDLNVELKIYTINGDLIEPVSTYYSLNKYHVFPEEGCKNNYHGRFYVSESDYIKLKDTKVEDGIEKDIDLFSEISLKVTGGSYFHCAEMKRKSSMIGLCPQDYPPLKNGEPWVNLSSYFKEYKWINE